MNQLVTDLGQALAKHMLTTAGHIRLVSTRSNRPSLCPPPLVVSTKLLGFDLSGMPRMIYQPTKVNYEALDEAFVGFMNPLIHTLPAGLPMLNKLRAVFPGLPLSPPWRATARACLLQALFVLSWLPGNLLKVQRGETILQTERTTYAVGGRHLRRNKEYQGCRQQIGVSLRAATHLSMGDSKATSSKFGAVVTKMNELLPTSTFALQHFFGAVAHMGLEAELIRLFDISVDMDEEDPDETPLANPYQDAVALVQKAGYIPYPALRSVLAKVMNEKQFRVTFGWRSATNARCPDELFEEQFRFLLRQAIEHGPREQGQKAELTAAEKTVEIYRSIR